MSRRALVAFYSRKGHVARVAESIAEALGADTERIIDRKFRGWPWSYIAANREAVNSIPANIVEPKRDPAGYDLVVVGSPVWKDRLSTPVLAYLRRFAGRLPEVAFFVTCAEGPGRALEDMAASAGRPPAATLVVLDADLDRGAHVAPLQEYLARLRRE